MQSKFFLSNSHGHSDELCEINHRKRAVLVKFTTHLFLVTFKVELTKRTSRGNHICIPPTGFLNEDIIQPESNLLDRPDKRATATPRFQRPIYCFSADGMDQL